MHYYVLISLSFLSCFLKFDLCIGNSNQVAKQVDVADSCVISSIFVESKYDNSNCPDELWLEAMSLHNRKNSYTGAVVLNIGFNKGYNLGLFLNLFAPNTNVTHVSWGNFVKSYYENHNVIEDKYNCGYCGCCGDCKSSLETINQYEDQVLKNSSSKSGVKKPNNFVFIGVDLNMENVAMVNDCYSHVASYFNINSSDSVVKLIHAAGGEKTEVITIPKCTPGDEVCRIPLGAINSSNAMKQKENLIEVLVVSVDDLVAELYSVNVDKNKISTNFSINPMTFTSSRLP